MRILFFTKSKPYTNKALQSFVEKGHKIAVVCKSFSDFEGSQMAKWCTQNNITVFANDDVYKELCSGMFPKFDLGISNTYGRLIKKELIDHLNGQIINLHGAILPDYKGMFAYNWGIYHRETEWGVTAHYVNENFDEGDIIQIRRFAINPETITVKELEELTQHNAYILTMELVDRFATGKIPIAAPQRSGGHYYSRQDFEKLKQIRSEDSAQDIQRKIHACWCPPYEGAYLERDGVRFLPRGGGTSRSLIVLIKPSLGEVA